MFEDNKRSELICQSEVCLIVVHGLLALGSFITQFPTRCCRNTLEEEGQNKKGIKCVVCVCVRICTVDKCEGKITKMTVKITVLRGVQKRLRGKQLRL